MTSFNPASFTTFNRTIQADMSSCVPVPEVMHCVSELREAAGRFEVRRDDFATGKAGTCRDIADKLERFGSFASDKQREFAVKLIEWSKPRQPRMTLQSDEQRADDACAQPAARAEVNTLLPKLHEVMQRHAKFYIGDVTLSRKQADQLVWVKHAAADKVVGKIDGGKLTLWSRPGVDDGALRGLFTELEADPLAAARKYGKLSGRCCSCGADLVDPESIERGQGPVCAGKF